MNSEELLGVEAEGLVWEDGIVVAEENAVLRLTFDAPADCELYVEMDGFAMTVGPDDMGNILDFETEGSRTRILLVAESTGRAVDRDALLVNLGWSAGTRTTAEIRFVRAGEYRLDGIRLYAQPMAEFENMIASIRENGLQNAVVGTDSVSGTVSLDEPGVLVFSIPASDGWKATVNGRAAELIDSADTFLALPLPAGEHEIELHYETPGLNIGLSITLICAALLLTATMPEWHSVRRRRLKGDNA